MLAKWTIRPRLMAIPGVANVAIWGQRDRQFQVLVDPERLAGQRRHARRGASRPPADAAAVDGGGFRRYAQPAASPCGTLSAIHDAGGPGAGRSSNFPRRRPAAAGRRGRRGRSAHPPPIGDAVINDGPGLLLIVEKQPTGNTLEVTREVEAALETLRPGLKDVEIDPTIFRPATFIERSLANLSHALLLGCVLVIADPVAVPVRLAHGADQL